MQFIFRLMAGVKAHLSSLILLSAVMLLAGCATTSGQNHTPANQPAANKVPAGNLQATLQQLINSNIVKAVSGNALASHSIVDYVSAALNSLQQTYSLDLNALIKQLNPQNAENSFYKGVYIAYSKRKDVAPEEINRTAIEAMLKLVDTSSRYYNAAYYNGIKHSLGKKGVIGVVLSRDRQGIRVVQVMDGSPADKAGLPVGGHIISIDNRDMTKSALSDVNILLRGEPGSALEVGIKAPDGVIHKYAVKRAILKVNHVKVRKLKNNILYIRIGHFDFTTRKQIIEQAAKLNFNPSSVILDLRICSGGVMKSVVAVGDLFLADGDFLNIKNTNPLFDTNFKTQSGDPLEKIRGIAILVSGATASGAEGLAMVLQQRIKARIIGSRTAGRNLIQSIFPLRDGSAIKLTTGRLELPKGKSWAEDGVRPDECINYSTNTLLKHTKHGCGRSYFDSKLTAGQDIALNEAIHYLSRRR